MTTEIQKFNIGIQKIGTTTDNRHLYSAINPDTNQPIKFSVSDEDRDIFEKTISELNKQGQKDFAPEELKKKRAKIITATSLLTVVGAAIPGFLTKNSKPLIKVLSIAGGAIAGAIAGAMVSLKNVMAPNAFKEAQTARETIKTLDIRKEV